MFTYQEIQDIILDELNHIGLWDCEIIYSDMDLYEETFWTLGYEPNAQELYASVTLPFGEMGGQCLAGQLGELMRRQAHDTFVNAFGPQLTDRIEECNFGCIFYYIDNMTRTVLSIYSNKGESFIRAMVRATVAHERRHSTQPASMYEAKDWLHITIDEYESARHEADADAFALAVIHGDTSADLDNPSAWHPERLVA